ncbi:MAG: hypothetical protein Q9M25_02240, partial [Mariprofundaceae bacterium]|nr:hypothetical protein [Mariprofundaceae bacterium]
EKRAILQLYNNDILLGLIFFSEGNIPFDPPMEFPVLNEDYTSVLMGYKLNWLDNIIDMLSATRNLFIFTGTAAGLCCQRMPSLWGKASLATCQTALPAKPPG